jgi:hypothetical protein
MKDKVLLQFIKVDQEDLILRRRLLAKSVLPFRMGTLLSWLSGLCNDGQTPKATQPYRQLVDFWLRNLELRPRAMQAVTAIDAIESGNSETQSVRPGVWT